MQSHTAAHFYITYYNIKNTNTSKLQCFKSSTSKPPVVAMLLLRPASVTTKPTTSTNRQSSTVRILVLKEKGGVKERVCKSLKTLDHSARCTMFAARTTNNSSSRKDIIILNL